MGSNLSRVIGYRSAAPASAGRFCWLRRSFGGVMGVVAMMVGVLGQRLTVWW